MTFDDIGVTAVGSPLTSSQCGALEDGASGRGLEVRASCVEPEARLLSPASTARPGSSPRPSSNTADGPALTRLDIAAISIGVVDASRRPILPLWNRLPSRLQALLIRAGMVHRVQPLADERLERFRSLGHYAASRDDRLVDVVNDLLAAGVSSDAVDEATRHATRQTSFCISEARIP